LITKRIEAAQKQVEGHNFTIRKHLLEYDDVMNQQRKTIYGLRNKFLGETDQKEYLLGLTEDLIADSVDQHCSAEVNPEAWNVDGLRHAVMHQFGIDILHERIKPAELNREELQEAVTQRAKQRYEGKEGKIGAEAMRMHERVILLNVLDTHWKDHLLAMDHLKEGIGLRGYGQRDPLVEYKKESFETFQQMMNSIEEESLRYLYLLQPVEEQERVQEMERRHRKQQLVLNTGGDAAPEAPKPVIKGPKVGRNEPCPCGSGKKYKKCCELKHA
jgi:preprotein translocase subunit SecA